MKVTLGMLYSGMRGRACSTVGLRSLFSILSRGGWFLGSVRELEK